MQTDETARLDRDEAEDGRHAERGILRGLHAGAGRTFLARAFPPRPLPVSPRSHLLAPHHACSPACLLSLSHCRSGLCALSAL
eukprot:2839912-Pleurochrysis_carterae.AAC.1